jgi:capsule polysaccharide modification protein KpsS
MHWQNLAKAGYEAYCKHLIDSKCCTTTIKWDDLSPYERIAWVVATKEIVDIFGKAVIA